VTAARPEPSNPEKGHERDKRPEVEVVSSAVGSVRRLRGGPASPPATAARRLAA
jgi:hypothetical protein